jgi:hypothetical protein
VSRAVIAFRRRPRPESVQEDLGDGLDDGIVRDRVDPLAAQQALADGEDQEHADEGAGGYHGVHVAELAGPDGRADHRGEPTIGH